MPIGQKLHDALNEQIKHEFYSAYLYLSMSVYCETRSLPGFAHWLKIQWQEEIEHAMKFIDHINDRGGRVTLLGIDKPDAEFGSMLELFEKVLEHERSITERINKLYGMAVEANDYATSTFLQWFVTEQVEEEKTADDVIQTLKQIGDNKSALIIFDREMGARSAPVGGDA